MASIQKRLQNLLDEGRSLRRSIELLSEELNFPGGRGTVREPTMKDPAPPVLGRPNRRNKGLKD